jgi:hypothetical protein
MSVLHRTEVKGGIALVPETEQRSISKSEWTCSRRSAIRGLEPRHNTRPEPDVDVATLGALTLDAKVAWQRPGDRRVGGGRDGNADHAANVVADLSGL